MKFWRTIFGNNIKRLKTGWNLPVYNRTESSNKTEPDSNVDLVERSRVEKKGEISHPPKSQPSNFSVSLANLQLRFPPHLTNLLPSAKSLIESFLNSYVSLFLFKTLVLGFWLDHRFLLIWIVGLWFWIGSYVLSVIISERCKLNRHGACADRFLGALHRRFLLLFFKFLVSIWKFEYLELISFDE